MKDRIILIMLFISVVLLSGCVFSPQTQNEIDIEPPVISHPEDVVCYEDESRTIIWQVSDSNPNRYSITIDGEIRIQDSWDGSSIKYEVNKDETTTLNPGIHEIVCTVYDEGDRENSDAVLVEIKPSYTRTVESLTPPMEFVILVASFIGAVAFILAFIKRKR